MGKDDVDFKHRKKNFWLNNCDLREVFAEYQYHESYFI